MSNLEMKIDTLTNYLLTDDPSERKRLENELRHTMPVGDIIVKNNDPEMIVRSMLLELGSPDHLIGHPYVVSAIKLVAEDRKWIYSITSGLYPQLATRFDTTAARVERAIRHLIEVTWTRGDLDVLGRYFGNTISPDKGKPTNGEFIARLAAILNQRLHD